MAMIVFSRADDEELFNEGKGRATDGVEGEGNEHGLEKWLMNTLAYAIRSMMVNHANHFFRAAEHGVCAPNGDSRAAYFSEDWRPRMPSIKMGRGASWGRTTMMDEKTPTDAWVLVVSKSELAKKPPPFT
jgi:hypothetical protein